MREAEGDLASRMAGDCPPRELREDAGRIGMCGLWDVKHSYLTRMEAKGMGSVRSPRAGS